MEKGLVSSKPFYSYCCEARFFMAIHRRKFLEKLTMASLMPVGQMPAMIQPEASKATAVKPTRPKKLSPGQTIGLVSPSAAIFRTNPYVVAVDALEAMGLRVKLSKHVYSRYGHLAGKDEERAEEINDMFLDPEVDAIICLRGGSGAARILDKLDYRGIAKNPKIFIGYSDITCLLLAIYAKTGLVTFHGPVAVSSWKDFSRDYFRRLLFEGETVLYENPGKAENEFVQVRNRVRTITPGKASGELVGGNLSVLCNIIGSDYLPSWKGKILFLEDTNEEIYRVDRMMTHLQLSGILKQLNGFVMGKCTNCEPGEGYGSLTLEEVFDHYIKPLDIPAYSGAMIGHIADQFTIPVGLRAEIDADLGTIQLSQPAVQ